MHLADLHTHQDGGSGVRGRRSAGGEVGEMEMAWPGGSSAKTAKSTHTGLGTEKVTTAAAHSPLPWINGVTDRGVTSGEALIAAATQRRTV